MQPYISETKKMDGNGIMVFFDVKTALMPFAKEVANGRIKIAFSTKPKSLDEQIEVDLSVSKTGDGGKKILAPLTPIEFYDCTLKLIENFKF